ncbi:MAG: AraC family transcriptional regulator [Planctomycetota bacterium]
MVGSRHDRSAAFKPEGFAGQTLHAVPSQALGRARTHPLLRGVCCGDVGYFPRAKHHRVTRPRGIDEDILILCVDGRGWVAIGQDEHELEPGVATVIPAGQPHAYGARSDAPWSIYWAHGVGQDMPLYREAIRSGPVRLDAAAQRKAIWLFLDMLRAYSDGYTLDTALCGAHALRHLLGLLACASQHRPRPTQRNSGASPEARAIRFMSDRLHHRLTLPQIAAVARLSPSRFAHRFRDRTGFPPMLYLTRLRIQRACDLLATQQGTVGDVASRVGYDDPAHFSRVFKRTVGVAPSTYRQPGNDQDELRPANES